MKKVRFGIVGDGREASCYIFENKKGMEMVVSNFGAVLISVKVPDRTGTKRDVVLGYETLEGYQANTNTYFGSTIGRNSNRIAGSEFVLSGQSYQMTPNENGNNLHSGPNGYQIRLWETEQISEEENAITFSLESPDGDQGFPGNMTMRVTYALTEANEVTISYEGVTDAETVWNPTNHSYFNLNGHESGSIFSHKLTIYANKYTPVRDFASIPTGELASVKATPMDFCVGKEIGREIDSDFEQLHVTGGYDHNFVLDKAAGEMGRAALVESAESGISMEVFTDLPGIQFYAGNFLEDESGKDGAVYGKRNGFCLETQYFPNAVNEPAFSAPIIGAGEIYRTQSVYRFSYI